MFEPVPEGVAVPEGLEHERFRRRMRTVDDVVQEFDAICDRVNHEGTPQPPFVPRVSLRVRRPAYEEGREWVATAWPFERLTYRPRDR